MPLPLTRQERRALTVLALLLVLGLVGRVILRDAPATLEPPALREGFARPPSGACRNFAG
ncbi:hypothetical protein ASA1KI_36250 [Opitutales bacterium ASA1]|uniref:hypothetical protein n=1 Tax=Congregicoccus parvus TaxID=3081749 RepID=UPI002B2E6CBC|nr:hypothetical protein ASA1KI_36250 [Opitutales bacterium ASA1]